MVVKKPVVAMPQIKTLDLRELEFAPYNPRAMTEEARRGLRESLDDFGLLELPVVNITHAPPRIVGGHQRVEALLAAGYTHADCVVTSFDDATEMVANVALNNHAIQGTFDPLRIVPDLKSIESKLPRPDFAQFSVLRDRLQRQARRLQANINPKADDQGEGKSSKSVSESGTVYLLGEHRLYCGDYADGLDVLQELSGGKNAAACIADPTYTFDPGKGGTPEAFSAFMGGFCGSILRVTDGPIYLFAPPQELHTVQQCFEDAGGEVYRWLVCVHDLPVSSPHDHYSQYEMCLYGAREGQDVYYYGKKARTNVFSTARPGRKALHPEQKPVALIRDFVTDSTDVGDLILDPGAGSGTTLVIAEETERVAYVCERDPRLCDTIRRRWAQQVHGKNAKWRELTAEEE